MTGLCACQVCLILRTPFDQKKTRVAARGHLLVVERLVDRHQATVSAVQNYAISFAAANGHLDVVRFLYARGGNPFELDLARQACKLNRHVEVMEFLDESQIDTVA